MKRIITTALTLLLLTALSSCGNTPDNSKKGNTTPKREVVKLNVDTISLAKRTFNKQIICNGKLRALQKSELKFATSGTIATVEVQGGSYVEEGALLATLETRDALIELNKSLRSMEKARIDLVDKLIGQGFDADTTAVPQVILDNAKHSSGYTSAEDDLQAAQRSLDDCYLRAPFAGRLANVDSKSHNATPEIFCTLIDDSYFDVEFNILEAELGEVERGERITATPFINSEMLFEGRISEINPLVDDNGQIKVRAKIRNRDGYLLEGMNVKLTLNRAIANQFVVPKSAVVLRDGYNVIFRYIDGEAVWTYVDVVMSNIDSHLIRGNKEKETTISEHDIVITSGNSNIADGTAVNVK
ncbi:MAG: efflux RND transporter periplasmic adaptor subunit [Rikenellaceae bacterium]